MSGSMPGYDGSATGSGGKRKKFAGYLKAANELRQSYKQSWANSGNSGNEWDEDEKGIPGAFPDVAIVSHGDEQLVLFPSYAIRHHKVPPSPDLQRTKHTNTQQSGQQSSQSDDSSCDEYWAREWQKFEDDRAIVDVDVRGWIYSPHKGAMTRRNRLLVGLARKLSGVPVPKDASRDRSPENSLAARHREHEAQREQEKIAEEAEQILRKGLGEERVAAQGGYSERPKYDSDNESFYDDDHRSGTHTPNLAGTPPEPGHLAKRSSWNQPSEMSQAELAIANTHLTARLRPFLTNPHVSMPVTLFFYDEKTSVSRTVQTNEAGHFTIRAALEFVPTHVRILASEYLSCTEEIKITEPKGVSLISDVDDTIKHSSIGAGAREIFRNTFIRDLGDLTIDGVKEWYNTMYDMGVGVHYVSNSPWQLFPVLVSFFRKAGLPPGSYHLKQYSGMLQGIFEPVAERKKGTLGKIMRDFPQRKFILIGDSGEADLEVYTDVALANPEKILAIFIRDVTTPANQGFFDSAMGPPSSDRRRGGYNPPPRASSWDTRKTEQPSFDDVVERRPTLPARPRSEVKLQTSDGPKMGKLIDFGDEPAPESVHESHRQVMPRSFTTDELDGPRRKSASDTIGKRVPAPPSKPLALRGASSKSNLAEAPAASNRGPPPPPPKSRRPLPQMDARSSPLSQALSPSDINFSEASEEGYVASARHKVSAAYNALPEVRPYLPGRSASPQRIENHGDSSFEKPPLPTRRTTAASSISKRLSWNSPDSSDDESYRPSDVPVNKKLDLWKRRWKRAKDILDGQGVALRSWRTGGDACIESIQMIEKAMKEMNVEGYGTGKGKTGSGGGEAKVKDLKR